MKFKLIGDDTSEVRIGWVIKQLKYLPEGIRILDAGAGQRQFEPHCSHLQYVSQDFAQYDGDGDGSSLQTGKWDSTRVDIVSDITRIPVDDASFDAILCSEVLEHVPDAISVLREFSRILKPGGTLLMTAPFCSLTHFAPYHFSGYNRYWYKHHLPLLGFKIEEIVANGTWFSFIAQELRRSRLVGKMYSSGLLGLITRIMTIPIIIILTLMERGDRGSSELLCFGYMTGSTKLAKISTSMKLEN